MTTTSDKGVQALARMYERSSKRETHCEYDLDYKNKELCFIDLLRSSLRDGGIDEFTRFAQGALCDYRMDMCVDVLENLQDELGLPDGTVWEEMIVAMKD